MPESTALHPAPPVSQLAREGRLAVLGSLARQLGEAHVRALLSRDHRDVHVENRAWGAWHANQLDHYLAYSQLLRLCRAHPDDVDAWLVAGDHERPLGVTPEAAAPAGGAR